MIEFWNTILTVAISATGFSPMTATILIGILVVISVAVFFYLLSLKV
jgi:hypothetical protein